MASSCCQWLDCPGGLEPLNLCCLGGLQHRINFLDAGQEFPYSRDQLFFQQGDFLFSIGMINPEAADWLAPVRAQQPAERLVAGMDEGDGIPLGE